MAPISPRTRRRYRDVERELNFSYRDHVGDGRIPWFSGQDNEWLEQHFGLEPGTILELYQNDVGLVGRASSLILGIARESIVESSRDKEPLNARGLPAWFSPEHNGYLMVKHTGYRSVERIYQDDQELVQRVKQLLVRELSISGRLVPEYDDQAERPARLAAIGDPPAYEPPDQFTLFGDTVPGDMWYQPPHILLAFYEMTDEQVAQLPDGIREQVLWMKVGWAQQGPDQRLDAQGMLVTRVPYRLTLDREYSEYLQNCTRDDIADMDLNLQATAIAVRRLHNSEESIIEDREWWQSTGYMLDDEFGGTGPWLAQREEVARRARRHPDDVFGEGPLMMPYVNTNVLDEHGGPDYIMERADQDLVMAVDEQPLELLEEESDSSFEEASVRDTEPVEALPDVLRIGHRPRAGFSVPTVRSATAGRSRPASRGSEQRRSSRSVQDSSTRVSRSVPPQPQRPVRRASQVQTRLPTWYSLSSPGQRDDSPTSRGIRRSPPATNTPTRRPRERTLRAVRPVTPPSARTISSYTPPSLGRERAISRASATTRPVRAQVAPTTPPSRTGRSSRTPPAVTRKRRSSSRGRLQGAGPPPRFNLGSIGNALRSVRSGGSRVSRPTPTASDRRQRASNSSAEQEEPARPRSSRRRRPS